MNRSFLIMQSQTSDILYYYILAFPLISYTTSAALFITTTALQYLITLWKRTRDVCYQPDHRQEIRIHSSGSALLLHHHQRLLLLLHRLLIHHCWLLLLLHHHHRLLLRHLIHNDRGLLLHLRLLLHLLRLLHLHLLLLHLLLLHLLLLHLLHLLLQLLILHLLLLHLLLHHCHLTGILIILRT